MRPEAVILAEAEAALDRGDPESALTVVMAGVAAFQPAGGGQTGFTAGFPRLDAFCQRLGRSLPGDMVPAVSSAHLAERPDVYIASEIYAIGGHTALIGDYARFRADRASRLLLTNHLNHPKPAPPAAVVRTAIPLEAVDICPASGLADKVLWLLRRIGNLDPARVFLLNHPEDPTPVAAAQPAPGRWMYFVHHADHSPALGVHAACDAHLDLTPRAAACCRAVLGVRNAVYMPLGCAEPDGPWRRRVRDPGATLITSSSGSLNKFLFEGPLAYLEVITTLLARTSVRHIHFGPLPRDLAAQWPDRPAGCGIDPARLVHVPRVDSLWRALSDFGVDLYLSSFPTPGARSTVEAMGAGIPVLGYRDASIPRGHAARVTYPETEWWSTPDELVARVRAADDAWLSEHQVWSRRHFERFHSREIIAPAFAPDPIAGTPPPHLGEDAIRFYESRISAFRDRWLQETGNKAGVAGHEPMR